MLKRVENIQFHRGGTRGKQSFSQEIGKSVVYKNKRIETNGRQLAL